MSRLRLPESISARPWLTLIWSIWVFLVPLAQSRTSHDWLWPTIGSYCVFLALFHRVHFGRPRHVLAASLATAALGFGLTSLNPGAQVYLIYACAYLPLGMAERPAQAGMVALLALYTGLWLWLGFPWVYSAHVVVVGLAVGAMTVHAERRRQADAALALSHEEVRRLGALTERERIGRDLHDLLGHTLSLVALKSELAAKLMDLDPSAACRELVDVSRVSREALKEVRSAVTGIRAAGLAAELASAHLLLEAGRVLLNYELSAPALPADVETVLALTVREAVMNIQRHAQARRASVRVLQDGRDAVLEIADDGRGGAITPGNGLSGMRERVESVGGRLRLESTRTGGTRIEVRVPLPAGGGTQEDVRS